MLYFSKYNIFSKIRDEQNYFIINLLTGNADIVDKETANRIINKDFSEIDDLKEKGYILSEEAEKKLYIKAYFDFIEKRDKEEKQLFFVPNYTCNFSCSYCYQSEYEKETILLDKKIIDAFFYYIDSKFNSDKKYITIFGGEPLLPSQKSKDNILYILNEANKRALKVAVVTNGYHLEEYLDIFKAEQIKEIQVTLDGVGEVHNNRRVHKSGLKTFDKIVRGVDLALNLGLTVNLRFVVDKENIQELLKLSEFAIKRGWTEKSNFKTQIGRNYELHYCQKSGSNLYTRVELYEDIYKMLKVHPEIMEFHKPAFSISKFLFENGDLPSPVFDSCPGCKSEWAFDYTGKIYACTATVGKKGEELGTFYPEIKLNNTLVEEWQDRDVTTIGECKDCSLQHACGGGCAAVAKNKHGSIYKPDCRPIKELIEMGIATYFKN